jgi:hypothetical protein
MRLFERAAPHGERSESMDPRLSEMLNEFGLDGVLEQLLAEHEPERMRRELEEAILATWPEIQP